MPIPSTDHFTYRSDSRHEFDIVVNFKADKEVKLGDVARVGHNDLFAYGEVGASFCLFKVELTEAEGDDGEIIISRRNEKLSVAETREFLPQIQRDIKNKYLSASRERQALRGTLNNPHFVVYGSTTEQDKAKDRFAFLSRLVAKLIDVGNILIISRCENTTALRADVLAAEAKSKAEMEAATATHTVEDDWEYVGALPKQAVMIELPTISQSGTDEASAL